MVEVSLDKLKITFSDSVLGVINQYKQTGTKDREAGGILLGQVSSEGIFVLKVSTPCSSDKASRRGFIRNKKKAQHIIDHEFVNSEGRTIYLGEWHTHPEPIPQPSPVDLRMIKSQFEKNHLNENFLITLIKGTEATYLGIIRSGEIKGVLLNDPHNKETK